MRLRARTMPVQKAGGEIQLALLDLQQEHDLTDIEMLQILSSAQQAILKYMLRAERHPGCWDAKADEEHSDDCEQGPPEPEDEEQG